MTGAFGVSGVSGVSAVMKKSRTATSRRPRQGPQLLLKATDASPYSSAPSSESSKMQSQSPDVSSGPDSSSRKEVDLNSLVPKSSKKTKGYGGPTQGYLDSTRSKEGMLAPSNWKNSSRQRESPSSDSGRGSRTDASESAAALSVENRLRKVKLKVGGVTRTIHAKSNTESTRGKASEKSRRLTRKRAPGKAFGEEGEEEDDYDDEDDEIRYLERLRASRAPSNNGWSKTSVSVDSKMERNATSSKRAYEEGKDISLSRHTKEGRKKPRSGRDSEDDMEEDEAESDVGDVEGDGQGQEALDSLADGKRELSLTTRQRALRFAKDGSGGSNTSLVEFPNGLPPAPSRSKRFTPLSRSFHCWSCSHYFH